MFNMDGIQTANLVGVPRLDVYLILGSFGFTGDKFTDKSVQESLAQLLEFAQESQIY